MGMIRAENSKLYANEYLEIYIPEYYFDDKDPIAENRGATVDTIGLLYIRNFKKDGSPNPVKLLNIPTGITLMVYSTKKEEIDIKGKILKVLTLQYLDGSYIMHQSVTKGRDIANKFLSTVLSGKVPKTLNYEQVLDVWWKNLDISGISYKVPSKIYEMILATIYRNPHNHNQRYGQYYGKQINPDGYDYYTANVREVVKNLSTFSGMVYEDIAAMISNGVNNNLKNVKEPESPLEKIIHY